VLAAITGGHTTQDLAFSLDNKRIFISVGSGSNVAEGMGKKDPEAVCAWEAEHGRGAAWDCGHVSRCALRSEYLRLCFNEGDAYRARRC